MPALLSVEKQSLGNDTLYMAVCYYFQMNGVLLLGYITYRNLSRLWNLLTASIDMIMLQVESNGQKHPGWCSTDCHSSRKPGGPQPPLREEGPAPDHPSLGLRPEELSCVYKSRLPAGEVDHLLICSEMCYS